MKTGCFELFFYNLDDIIDPSQFNTLLFLSLDVF